MEAKHSHKAHENHIRNLMQDIEKRLFLHEHTNCGEYEINIRTLNPLLPLLKSTRDWLTVGDYNAIEAAYLNRHNQNAIASDISDVFLKEASSRGYIVNYRKENAERLSLSDKSVDYALCRQSYHHFPRAYMAIYEMIRVSKIGVVLVEPIDVLAYMPIVLLIKNICDQINPQLINKVWKNRFSWEQVGNYVFKLSGREVEKIAMGLGLPCIALMGFNRILSQDTKLREAPVNQKALRKAYRKVSLKNIFCKIGLIPYDTLCAIIFKVIPDDETIRGLQKGGWVIVKLPENPYLKENSKI